MRDSFFSPEFVIGYHGCTADAAKSILATGQVEPSNRNHEWLGEGVYFWEYAPHRGLEWAKVKAFQLNSEPAVLEARIDLGVCLNLLDIEETGSGLSDAFTILKSRYAGSRFEMPRNTSRGAHRLDCAVIDLYVRLAADGNGRRYQTVRGCYPEGAPLYAGSKLLSKTHVQICVRDVSRITSLRLLKL